MVSRHAEENAAKYLNPNFTNRKAAGRFQSAVNAAMSNRTSTAVILTLDKAAENPYRDDWFANDRLVGIIRDGNLVTVMLSRKNQINSAHLRTDRVVIV